MLSGRAVLMHDELPEPLPLQAGDVAVLPQGEPHQLAAHPDAPLVPFRQIADAMGLAPWTPDTRFKAVDLAFGSGEPRTTLISGVFAFGDHPRNPLLGSLPTVLSMRGADNETEIGPALAIMHREPEKPWSVETLARERGMSRSRFAARFQDVVGQAPLEYLTQWRMHQAAGRLGEGRITLAQVAASVGYRSDVSFSKAFKRWAGRSPAEYRRWLTNRSSAVTEKFQA